MSLVLITTINRWQASAAEDFPDPSTESVLEGSTVHLVSTGEQFILHDGAWEPDLREARAIRDAEALP